MHNMPMRAALSAACSQAGKLASGTATIRTRNYPLLRLANRNPANLRNGSDMPTDHGVDLLVHVCNEVEQHMRAPLLLWDVAD